MKNQRADLSPNGSEILSTFDWNDLKYFLSVAREGGLSKAALQLGTSASTVSRHISALEARLKVRLFVRLTTGYLLTDVGSELYEQVAEVERSTLAVARGSAAVGEKESVTGLVRLATADSVGTFVLAPHLVQLRQRHPGLRIELLLGHAQVDLSRREADLALRMLDAANPQGHPDHVMHRITTVPFGLYASPAFISQAQAQSPDAWRTMDHIGWDSGWRHLPLAQWLARTFSRPAVASSNSMTAHFELIRSGAGIGLLPRYMAARDPSLIHIPAEGPPERELWLIYHRDLRGSKRVQAVRRFVEEVIPSAIGG
ncbi:MAG: LysR family transcriptional regulator [Burkholderiales bacterium]|nr:LysR family transcriptional regulator [Burkholderiales bacterium]MDE2076786.1 LysR family transcriptional regulator [Burkholderiales bacterium]MDE2431974.1 LysR family transcriptional regulator [Burkholderiales bacterium]